MYFTSRHVYLRSPEKRVKRRRAQIQAARQSAEEIESAKSVCAWCSMPFSNTPFDLKTVIVRALDSCVYKRRDENSNGCLNRSSGDIKALRRLLFQ